MTGKIICLGLGPGDPDLMSVRAARMLASAKQVAYFRKAGNPGHARSIVEGLLPESCQEIAMEYPLTTEIPATDPRYRAALSEFYAACVTRLQDAAKSGDVLVLCEGDPFLYGSFMHLHSRLPRDMVQVVPGISGMSGCWSASGQPITWGDDVLTVLPATLPQPVLEDHIQRTDALVVMKIGRNLDKLRAALEKTGRADDAWLVEYGTMPNQRLRPLSEVTGKVPYFSILLLHGQGRRP